MRDLTAIIERMSARRMPPSPLPFPVAACETCGGAGWLADDTDRTQVRAVPCQCRLSSDEMPTPNEVQARAWAACLAFAARRRGSLLLLGAVGVGKTHLATATYRLMAVSGGRSVVAALMLDDIRGSGDQTRTAEAYRRAGLLLLDDVRGARTAWEDQAIYELLAYRHAHGLPTIATTNVAPGEIGERLRSRLFDRADGMATVVRGDDVRRVGVQALGAWPRPWTARGVATSTPYHREEAAGETVICAACDSTPHLEGCVGRRAAKGGVK